MIFSLIACLLDCYEFNGRKDDLPVIFNYSISKKVLLMVSEKSNKCIKLGNNESLNTKSIYVKIMHFFRIHITFSLATAKIEMSLSLFIFTHTKYIWFKRRINFLSKTVTHKKIKIKDFWEKIYRTLLWQLKVKEWKGTRTWTIKIISLESLKTCLQLFLTQLCIFYCQKRLLFT